MERADSMAGLKHIPVGMDKLAEPRPNLRVDIQMRPVGRRIVRPEIRRGARQIGSQSAIKHLGGTGHTIDQIALKVRLGRAFQRFMVALHGSAA